MVTTILSSAPDYTASLLYGAGMLVVIGIVAFFTVKYAAPKLNITLKNSRLQIKAVLNLKPGNSLYIIKIDKKEILVGVSAAGISYLKEVKFNDSDLLEDADLSKIISGEEGSVKNG